MDCSFLVTPNGSVLSMDQIVSGGVEELKNGYYANVLYSGNGERFLMSEGWSVRDAALECLLELLNWICSKMGGGFNIRIGDFMDFCPTSALNGGRWGPDEIISGNINSQYPLQKVSAYNNEIKKVTDKVNNIFK